VTRSMPPLPFLPARLAPTIRVGRAALVVSALLWLGARPARADVTVSESTQPTGHWHSPQTFAAQLSFGPYRPDVDSEFDGKRTPYADYFGDGKNLLSQVQVEYQILHRLGTLGVGLGVGFFRVSAAAPVALNPAQPSGDKSTLTMVPVSLSAVYRFDYFLERDGFPLVPHAKLGLDWAYWRVTDGNGEVARAGGLNARGGSLGWHAVIGLALVLDFLDPTAARDFDVEMGVNHTALVFEFGHYDISGLGMSNRMHLGDNAWTLGLLFEF